MPMTVGNEIFQGRKEPKYRKTDMSDMYQQLVMPTRVPSSQDDDGAVQRRQSGLAGAHPRLRRFGHLQNIIYMAYMRFHSLNSL